MLASWILFAAAGYFLLAFTSVADKFFVSKVVHQPITYAFLTATTGPFSLIVAFFGGDTLGRFQFLSFPNLIMALLAGVFFIIGIFYSYSAIFQSSVSRVVPIQGGLVPLFSFLFAYVIVGERLSANQTLGFVFLVAGAVIISFRKDHGVWRSQALFYAAVSAACFALCSVLTKYTFVHSNYITGMVWTRIGFVVPIPFILMFKKNRKAIFSAPKQAGVKNTALYYTSRATGTAGGFLQSYAVSLGAVSVVNALQGLQFVFLLALTSFLSIYFPKVLKEKISIQTISLKLVAIAVISCGLYLFIK